MEVGEGGSDHMISSEVFHESRDKFDKGALRGEGVGKYYLRHFYVLVGIIVGV